MRSVTLATFLCALGVVIEASSLPTTVGNVSTPLEESMSDSSPYLKSDGASIAASDEDDEQGSRTSWWECTGDAAECFAKLTKDIRMNMAQDSCSICRLRTRPPSSVASLERLSKRLQGSSCGGSRGASISATSGSLQFDEDMQLIANVLIQKSRYCVLDMASLAALVGRVAASSERPATRSVSSFAVETTLTSRGVTRATAYTSSSASQGASLEQ